MIAPAGEMWSVVIESPKMPSARAPLTSLRRAGRHREAVEERRLGDVGRRRPVVDLPRDAGDASPHRVRVGDVAVVAAVDLAGRARTAITAAISCDVGQMSPRYTSWPSLPLPTGSVIRSLQHACPAIA